MGDPLSVTAGIIAILQISGIVTRYLTKVEGATDERERLLAEVRNGTGILSALKDRLEGDPTWLAKYRRGGVPLM